MKKRILSLFLAVLMFLGAVPAPSFAADAETTPNSVVGCTATFNVDFVWLYTAPGGISQIINASFIPHVVVTAVEGEYYRIDAAEGYTWPKGYESAHYVKAVYLTLDSPETAIVDKNGDIVSSVTMGQYEKPELTANSPFSTADVDYQWQIEYEDGKWVDIHGEDAKTVKLSFGMVATLLGDDGNVDIRCKTTAGTQVAYSKPITVTIEMYQSEEPDVVVSESFTTSSGETVTVTVAGSLPDDAAVELSETDSTGVDVKPSETVVAALDISIKNADGTEWQPASGDTVTVALEASKVGLENGDEFVVYHLHNDEVRILGAYKVVNNTVTFEVDGFSKFVFALAEMTISTDDLQDDRLKGATVNTTYNTTLWMVKDPATLTSYNNGWYVEAKEGVDYAAGTEFIITDVYVSNVYPYGIFYKVRAINSENVLSDVLNDYPWVLQRYQDDPLEYNALIIEEVPQPVIPEAPDHSADIGMHAHLTQSDNVFVMLLDKEPDDEYSEVSWIYEITEFSTDFTVQIDGYKVVSEINQVADEETGKLAGYVVRQSLWYQVSIVGGTCNDEFLNGWWVFQNYITEGEAYENDMFTLFDAPEQPEDPTEPSVGVTIDGEKVTEITVSTAQKVTLTATPNVEGTTTYKWQLLIPQANMWVDISGQTSADCIVNYGMVANRLDAEGKAHIRCVTTVDGKEITSEPVSVNIAQAAAYSVRSLAWSASAYDVMPLAEGDGTGGVQVSNPVTITIRYVLGSDPTKIVDEPIVATIQKGTAYILPQYDLPVLEGYSAYLEDDTDNIYTTFALDIPNVTDDITITFKYWPAKVNYTVIYYWQNADNDNYTEHERVVLTDFTGNTTTVEDKKYDGFYQLLYETVPIASDGSTVIEVYYDRYYYLMLFNLDGGYGVQPVYARHGATLPTLIPTKAGCDFVGWDSDADNDNDVDETFPRTMPIGDTNYTAIWQFEKEKVELHVVVWGENPNDEEYSYKKTEVIEYAPGTTVNYMKEVLTCSVEAHSHSEACGYACGKEPHTHENCVYDCEYANHTHTKSCYGGGNANTDSRNTYDAPSNPVNGTVYKRRGIFTSYDKIVYFDGTWYIYNGSASSETVVAPTCHTHNEICYACDKTEHVHDSACGYKCGKQTHWHNDQCYTKEGFLDDELWALVKSDEVVVAPDGSTIMNVYYDRTEFTLTFKEEGSNGKTLDTITDKWGASIMKRFENVSKDHTFFWSKSQYGGSPWTSFMDIMPQENRAYYADPQSGNSTLTANYYAEKVDGSGYEVIYTVSFKGSSTITVTDEEFVDIEGFVFNDGLSTDIGDYYNGAKFFYDRATYKLQFHDNGETGIINDLTKNIVYQRPLGEYAGITLGDDYAPAKYEPGSVKFAGWYTNPEGEGEPFDFENGTMPAASKNGDPALVLYAKWTPVTHTVKFYTDKQYVGTDTIYTNSNGDKYIYEVPHGSKIQDPLTPPADPVKGQYQFNGWYYTDAEGNEQRWDFKNTTVTRDIDIYAKWSSNKLMPYTVKFVYLDDNNNEIEIAAPITGSALGGNSKTFDAKGNQQLYENYREGYFPLVQSHTITIDLEDTSKNEFTFYYVKKDAVPYKVYYVAETPKEGETSNETVELNGVTYYIIEKTKEVFDNKKAIVTETYIPIAGYLPNSYQETLVINPDATEDNPNQIIFVYSVDTVNSMYIVHYYFQDSTGKPYVENMTYLFQSKAKIGSTVHAAILTVENFSHSPSVSGTKLEGTIEKDKILELHVYYDRNPYNYKVQYMEEGTSKVLMPAKIVSGSLWDSIVTEQFVEIPNYTLSSDPEMSIQIRKDTEDPTVNIVTFFYTENKITIKYEVVGPDGCGAVEPTSETLKVLTGKASGSVAKPSSSVYKFVGWYDNENCTGDPLSTDATYVPTKSDDALWVDGTTYFAKFEYNLTSLTIVKDGVDGYSSIDPNQTFIFNIKGDGIDLDVTVHGPSWTVVVDGLTVGETYTVTEKTNWSWRYEYESVVPTNAELVNPVDNGAEIKLGLNATITFTNERSNKQWLDGDSWCNNIFNN